MDNYPNGYPNGYPVGIGFLYPHTLYQQINNDWLLARLHNIESRLPRRLANEAARASSLEIVGIGMTSADIFISVTGASNISAETAVVFRNSDGETIKISYTSSIAIVAGRKDSLVQAKTDGEICAVVYPASMSDGEYTQLRSRLSSAPDGSKKDFVIDSISLTAASNFIAAKISVEGRN